MRKGFHKIFELRTLNPEPRTLNFLQSLPSNPDVVYNPGMEKRIEYTALKWPEQIMNIAHRGARSLAPENTIAAAEKGLANGADAWEIDVQMTRDGELVLVHDNTLDRTSNVVNIEKLGPRNPWPVHEFTLDELRSLNFGDWFIKTDPFGQIAAGAVSPTDLESYRLTPVTTLDYALTWTRERDWLINVEIKDLTGLPGDDEIVSKVIQLIKTMDMSGRVIISSFKPEYVSQVKLTRPDIAAALLVEEAPADPPGPAQKHVRGCLSSRFLADRRRSAQRTAGGKAIWSMSGRSMPKRT